MSEENKETEVVVENTDTEEVEAVEDVEATEAPEVEDAKEPNVTDLSEALQSIQASLERATASEEERELALTKVREAVEGVEAKVTQSLEKLLKEHEGLVTEFKSFKEGLNGIEKRLDNVEGSTAFQKSLGVESAQAQPIKENKGFWAGSFVDND